jgi:hypothetical protein
MCLEISDITMEGEKIVMVPLWKKPDMFRKVPLNCGSETEPSDGFSWRLVSDLVRALLGIGRVTGSPRKGIKAIWLSLLIIVYFAK